MKLKKIVIALSLAVTGLAPMLASADHNGGGYYRPMLLWHDGQRPAPNHGTPYGLDHCGTENVINVRCYEYGYTCYVNSGYYWDNYTRQNMFNVYTCRR